MLATLRGDVCIHSVLAAFVRRNRFLVVLEKKEWQIPGGKPEKDETPSQCLQREVREELIPHLASSQRVNFQNWFQKECEKVDFLTFGPRVFPQVFVKPGGKIGVNLFVTFQLSERWNFDSDVQWITEKSDVRIRHRDHRAKGDIRHMITWFPDLEPPPGLKKPNSCSSPPGFSKRACVHWVKSLDKNTAM